MADLEKIAEDLSALSVLEAAELSKLLEENGAFPPRHRLPLLLPRLPVAMPAVMPLKPRTALPLFLPLRATRKSTSSKKFGQSPVWV